VDEIAKKLKIEPCDEAELKELEQDVAAETLLSELETRANDTNGNSAKSRNANVQTVRANTHTRASSKSGKARRIRKSP
jgi:hypothetical protein